MIQGLLVGIVLVAVVIAADRFVAGSADTAAITSPPATAVDETREPTIRIIPRAVQQGEPALIAIEGIGTSTVASLTLGGTPLDVFSYNGRPSALVGIDLKKPDGPYPLVATLSDGTSIEGELFVGKRLIVQAPLGIPDNLGGNTPEGERRVVTSLARENAIIESVQSSSTVLWSEPFLFPLENPIVTDEYGYSRLTGKSTISHKGTDFRASIGTPISAMNDGIVRVAREFVIYGNTIIIDHGLGVHTLYMHLSEIDVQEGERVGRGQIIGKSGKTGYSEFPHLHISVKIDGISIDPMRFLALF